MKIVTVFVHKYNIIMPHPIMKSFDSRDRLPRRWLLYFWLFVPKYCMKLNKIGPKGGANSYRLLESANSRHYYI